METSSFFNLPMCHHVSVTIYNWAYQLKLLFDPNLRQLEAFRSTLFSDKKPMGDNFRPVQPLNNRQVSTIAVVYLLVLCVKKKTVSAERRHVNNIGVVV